MSDAVDSILLMRRILCREALATAQAELVRLRHAMPVLFIVAGVSTVAAVLVAVLSFSGIASGHGASVTAGGIWWGLSATLGLMARPFIARLGELGALPHWRARQVAGELLFAATLLVPLLALMAGGWALFLASEHPTPEIAFLGFLRLTILAVGCLAVSWAGFAGRGWQAWLVTGCSGGAIGFFLIPQLGWAVFILTPLLLPWIWRTPAPAGPSWRLPRPDLPALSLVIQLLRERPSDTGFRLGIGILISLLGWAWLGTVPDESRPLALMFVGGLVGLAVHGLVHLTTGFRQARRELVEVLPIAPWRWLLLGAILPLGFLFLMALILGAWLLTEGLAPGPVLLAMTMMLVQGAVTVCLVYRAPEAGGLLAIMLHIAVIRGAVAVVR